ncbi:MAG: hypothetical protein JJT88_19215 [Gammaproteobacteria bacterium]|nr:hypothetical protein [Gammaproteobacteria bacterium]
MLLVLAAGLSLTLPALAQQPAGADQVDQLAEALGLNAQQQTEIRAVIDDLGPQIEALQERAQRVQMELADKVGHDYDESAIRSGAARLGEITGEMTALSLLLQSKVQAVFTAEQRAELEMQAQRQRQMQEEMMRQQFQQQQGQQPGQPGGAQPDW